MTTAIALRRDESAALRAYEATIEGGLSGFIRVGNALAAIRDARLYRTTHDTFEDYCQARWKLGRQRAYSLIDAATTAAEMSEISDTPPVVESHAAELAKASPEQRAAVWEEVVESAPRRDDGQPKPTARQVRAVVECQRSRALVVPLSPADDKLPPQNLTKLVRTLRVAIESERKIAPIPLEALHALKALKSMAARGLYSPATDDPHEV